jgi:hypothetical protein
VTDLRAPLSTNPACVYCTCMDDLLSS